MTIKRKLVSKKQLFQPKNTVCPICNSRLLVSANGCFIKDDNDDWIAENINIDCETRPERDNKSFKTWIKSHYRFPYIDWLPIEEKLLLSFQLQYKFDINEY